MSRRRPLLANSSAEIRFAGWRKPFSSVAIPICATRPVPTTSFTINYRMLLEDLEASSRGGARGVGALLRHSCFHHPRDVRACRAHPLRSVEFNGHCGNSAAPRRIWSKPILQIRDAPALASGAKCSASALEHGTAPCSSQIQAFSVACAMSAGHIHIAD